MTTSANTLRLMRHMADRCAREDTPLVASLWRDRTEADLLAALGCTPDQLTRLRLCYAPRNAGEVDLIATRLGLDAARLVAALDNTTAEPR